MLLITYQSKDYKEFKNPKYKSLKKLLGIPEEKSVYWCIKANNLQQAVLNSFCIAPNQPFYMVMFETDDYYEVDAIKWNYDVDNGVTKLDSSHIQIEYNDSIEYVVTDIPEKRIEIPVVFFNLLNEGANRKNQESEDFYYHLASVLSKNNAIDKIMDKLPNAEELNKIGCDFVSEMNIPKELVQLRIHYIFFIGIVLPTVYAAGRAYLLEDTSFKSSFNLRHWQDICQLNNAFPNNNEGVGIESFYNRIKNYRKFVYQQLFLPIKKQYPNEPCLCGSGKKYKKCCANFDSKLDAILKE